MSAKIEKFMCLLPQCFYVDKIRPGERTISKRIASVRTDPFISSSVLFLHCARENLAQRLGERITRNSRIIAFYYYASVILRRLYMIHGTFFFLLSFSFNSFSLVFKCIIRIHYIKSNDKQKRDFFHNFFIISIV